MRLIAVPAQLGLSAEVLTASFAADFLFFHEGPILLDSLVRMPFGF
jgi:hypothetical protein